VPDFHHGLLDRRTLVTYHDTSTTASTYDAGDRLTQVNDSVAGTITRSWDGLDRLTQEDPPEGLVTYTYDDAGRRASMTVAGQSAVSYTYDNANRLTQIAQGTATVGFAYDNGDRRTTLTLPNGIEVASTYDDTNQLTQLTYRLGAVTLGNLTYAYDFAGNRTSVGGTWARTGLPSAMTSATYDAANQITTWNSTTFSYDFNGNLTGDGTNTYTWNARDQLTALSGGVSAGFAYDGLGRRQSRTVSGTSRGFLYDGLNVVQELASGTPTANQLTGLGIDETFTRAISGGPETILPDALGSTVALANVSGSVQKEYTYSPYGETTASGTSSTNTAQFTGRENDGTGLMYYRARYYSPRLQRFTSEDPIGFVGGINVFAYVENSPTSFVDPLAGRGESQARPASSPC
jgi:RHS repeat-associated protein